MFSNLLVKLKQDYITILMNLKVVEQPNEVKEIERKKTNPNAKILVGKKEVKVSKDGFFVFGIDRDQKYDLTFTKIINGKESITTKKVLKRKYNIQRIDGLAESKVTPPESVYKRIKKENNAIGEAEPPTFIT